jgi:hypothetical protein
MNKLKLKIITIVILALSAYFLLYPLMALWHVYPAINNFLEIVSEDPSVLFSPVNFWKLITIFILLAAWVFILYKLLRSVNNVLRRRFLDIQTIKMLDEDKRKLDIFLEVAQKEFMKRRISKQTFEDIQIMAGKKLVEIKAKKKELEEKYPKKKKSKKKAKGKWLFLNALSKI